VPKKMGKAPNFFASIFVICLFSFSLYASPLDKAETFTLSNGLTVAAKPLSGSGLVAIEMWVKGGLLAEGKYLGSGISHFIEHMLFKGTEKRGPGDIPKEIHRLGGELNAATSLDYTYYKIILPKEHLSKGLEILADAIQNPIFSEEEFIKERDVILKEINMGEDSPSKRLWKILFREAFISHPYREPIIGRRDFFENLTCNDLVSFYKSHYTPAHMVLAIAGGIDMSSIKGEVENYFKDWKTTSNFSFPSFHEPQQITSRKLIEHFPAKKAYFRMGFHIPGIESEDLYSLDLLAFILGNGRASRLYMEIKEKKALADSLSAFSYTPSGQGIFGVDALTGPEKVGALEEAVLQEIEKIKRDGVEEKELERAKKIIQSEYKLSKERVASVAADIGYNKLILGDANFGSHYIERIKQVGKEEIKDIASKFLRQENLTICILTPEEKVARGPASGDSAEKARIIHKYILPDNLVLLTCENKITPMVNLNLLFKGGVICEAKEKNGVFALLSKCLIRSTKKKEYLELHSEIESRGGSLSSYSGYNSFGLSFTLPREDLGWGIEILASLLREPLFKEKDIEKAKEELDASLKIEDDDILTRAFYLFREAIFNKHPYSWRDKGTEESLKKITREDIISAYKKFCFGQTPVLAIFGDINEKQTISLVERKFRFLKGSQTDFKEFPSPGELPRKKDITLPREQAILVFGFPGVSVKDEDRFTIDVITTALSGQSGRLFTAVREKRGQAYFVGAFQIMGVVPGAIVFYTGTTSEKLDEVKKVMEREIERLKKGFLPQQEIEKAKENLIGKRRISLETNSSFGFDAALNELYGLGFNFYLNYERNIRKVDRVKIKKIAQKYFKKELMSCVIINPEI